MAHHPIADTSLEMLRATIVALVAGEGVDLTARQLAVFLICYLNDGPHTVRGLATALQVAKPIISRAIDKLAKMELARRGPEPGDRRSIVVKRTSEGMKFLRKLRGIMNKAHAESATS